MWLLDVNVPQRLIHLLKEFNIAADHSGLRGWDGLTNGALVSTAAGADFTAILTRDRQFSESAARALKRYPHFSVVLITLPQLRGDSFLERFREEWLRNPIEPAAGSLISWPSVA